MSELILLCMSRAALLSLGYPFSMSKILGSLQTFMESKGTLSLVAMDVVLLVALAVIVFIWLAPILIAKRRGHPNLTPICIIIVLLGWTLVGWAVCLVWSFLRTHPSYKSDQMLLSGVKLAFLLLLVAAVCLVGPLYQHFHGTVTVPPMALGWFLLGFVLMFFGAPWYTFSWGLLIFSSLFWWDINKSHVTGTIFVTLMWLYEGVGLTWVLWKLLRWAKGIGKYGAQDPQPMSIPNSPM